MAEIRYRAKIDHTEKTIETLYRMQRYTYDKPRILLRLGTGLILAAVALTVTMPMWAKALLLLAGAWLLASRDFPAQMRADRVLQERKASLPKMQYEFYDDHLKLSGEGSMDIGYKKLSRLAEDERFFYLFLSRDSVCMLERDSLKPKKQDDFRLFLEERSGQSWRREKSFLSMNLPDLLQLFRDRKQK